MEITKPFAFGDLVLSLSGRFDATSSRHFEEEIQKLLAGGHREIHLDMKAVDYISSAGLRGLLKSHKSLAAAGGALRVIKVSQNVTDVLNLAGFQMLLPGAGQSEIPAPAESKPIRTALETATARFDFLNEATASGVLAMKDRGCGPVEVGTDCYGLGIGTLGAEKDWRERAGELLVAGGTSIYQPTDGSSRADDMVATGNFLPILQFEHGCIVHGQADGYGHFEAKGSKAVPWSEIAKTVQDRSDQIGCLVVMIAETADLVGATLLVSPKQLPEVEIRFLFPEIRDRIGFTAESAHGGRLSLVVALVFGGPQEIPPGLSSQLRPCGKNMDLIAHAHAAVFPYHPLARTEIMTVEQGVQSLMREGAALTVLHLLADDRESHPHRESLFWRGSFWWMPLRLEGATL